MKLKEHHNESTAFQEFPQLPAQLAILPLHQTVIYPHISMPLHIADEKTLKLIQDLPSEHQLFGVVARQSEGAEDDAQAHLFSVGTAVKLVKSIQTEEGDLYAIVTGISRIRIHNFVQDDPYAVATVDYLHDSVEEDGELILLSRTAKDLVQSMVTTGLNIPQELLSLLLNLEDAGLLSDLLAENPRFSLQERQELLENLNVNSRLRRLIELLTREKEHIELSHHIQSEVQNKMNQTQREYYLREQLKAIQKELGEVDSDLEEIEELRRRLTDLDLPDDAHKVAEKEVERLAKMHPASAEYTVSRTYIDWILDLPWTTSTEDTLDIHHANTVLEADHYGLEKVKQRIIEYLAVRQLTQESKGPILCFVGPPGVGKTSLGQSIARALNRKFVRMSLGGIRDEAEIRGHRRTYIGALPGRIIQGLKKAGSKNPVFMLDEIDKVGTDFRGDPASALLEVLDPEQNNTFSDHYLEIPFDLSQVIFIATANVLTTIPPALLDRMEVIEIVGYTEEEKSRIAQQYLIPRQLNAHGLTAERLLFEENALITLIHGYTREAGVRNLEREIAAVCRGVAKQVVDGHSDPVTISDTDLARYLGPIKYFSDVAERTSQPGVATGLAWTPVGGDILFIETTRMKGHEKLILTGKLGEIMKESAEIALSYVRSKAGQLGIPENFQEDSDIHVHIPSGAISKDGPSAGVPLSMSLLSLLTNTPVRSDTAMTGEVTLRGNVLPVGGIKEKVLAARHAGLKHVILPAKNEKDLEDVPEQLRQDLAFHFVDKLDEVIPFALKRDRKGVKLK